MTKIESSKIWDDKTKSNVYTFRKTSDDGKTSIYTVNDYDGDGIDSHDGMTVKGDASIWGKGELSKELQDCGYRESSYAATTKDGKDVNLSEVNKDNDGNITMTEGTEYNLGSFAKANGVSTPNTPYSMPYGGFQMPPMYLQNNSMSAPVMPQADPIAYENFFKKYSALFTGLTMSATMGYDSNALLLMPGTTSAMWQEALSLFKVPEPQTIKKDDVKVVTKPEVKDDKKTEDIQDNKKTEDKTETKQDVKNNQTNVKVIPKTSQIEGSTYHDGEIISINEKGETVKEYKDKVGNKVVEIYVDGDIISRATYKLKTIGSGSDAIEYHDTKPTNPEIFFSKKQLYKSFEMKKDNTRPIIKPMIIE